MQVLRRQGQSLRLGAGRVLVLMSMAMSGAISARARRKLGPEGDESDDSDQVSNAFAAASSAVPPPRTTMTQPRKDHGHDLLDRHRTGAVTDQHDDLARGVGP
ncbi:hypothetical protein [Streptomyces europaeiscabiei]|uniref:hypothetical protein n=1 Tax=Streptomyces europaeiscabiei TaxID=146819 RepID=UPI0038F6FD88